MNANPGPASAIRLGSIDAFRGLVMFLMMAEVLAMSQVAKAFPDSGFWSFLARHQTHAEWVGCSLHDLIQPAFSFLVGVALAFSVGNRLARGQSTGAMLAHALWRAFLLVVLGIFLRSIGHPRTCFTFEDTLTQIGLGYAFLFLAGLCTRRVQWAALGVLLVGYWLAFALYPLPGPTFDWGQAGVAPTWEHNLPGFAAHWNKNTNLAWAFDTWFLNLFPRENPFTHNGGGYSTLSFIPTLATMILGLIAGGWLRRDCTHEGRLKRLVLAGAASLALGWLLGVLGICPVVKRIWTPSWTLYSGGWCFLILAGFYAFVEVGQFKLWVFPLIVIGMNSIASYVMDWLFVRFIRTSLHTHLGDAFFRMFGDGYQTLVEGGCILVVLWLLLFWMYRRKFFLKI
jgi:heparan-alpha-glucosaminide N-acetyltransferase